MQFPVNSPFSERIADDPVFDPAIHLALEQPDSIRVRMLFIRRKASKMASASR
jgi:hypothetical protein